MREWQECDSVNSIAIMSSSPPPVSTDEKWDHSAENAVRKTSIGFVSGLLPSVILARSLAARCAIVFLAAGIGAGVAYGEARYLFDHDVTFDKRHLVQIEWFAKKDTTAASSQ